MRNAVVGASFRRFLIEDVEGLDDFRFGVGQQRVSDVPAFRETLDRRGGIVADRGQAITELADRFEVVVPGDRLGFTIGSPIERSGEQQDQAAFPLKGPEIPRLPALIRRGQAVRDRLADLRPLLEGVGGAGVAGVQGRQDGHDRDGGQTTEKE
jgi:hypothetical protein